MKPDIFEEEEEDDDAERERRSRGVEFREPIEKRHENGEKRVSWVLVCGSIF
jgi:hypothetical protein